MSRESQKQCASNQNGTPHASVRTDASLWLDEHGDVLYRYAKARVGHREIAEDLVQEALLAGLRGHQNFRGDSSERTWLVGILKRKIVDFHRQHARDAAYVPVEMNDDWIESLFDDRGGWKAAPRMWGNAPSAPLEQSEFWQIFTDCLGKVPERMREAFSRREIDEVSSEYICQEMGITSTNLWVLLYRARVRLWKCLEANWFGSECER